MDAETAFSYIQFYGPGAFGAFCNQILYWKKIFESEREKHLWMIIYSASYVAAGGGVGCVVGYAWNHHVLVFCVGFAWPDFCLAMTGVKGVIAKLVPLLHKAILDSDDDASGSDSQGC